MNRALNADAPVNQSVERAVRLLGFFSPEEPELTLARLTELLGTSKATTHRYTLALRRVGLLRFDSGTGVYSLGPRIVELAATALAGLRIVRIAGPTMERLVAELNETVVLSIWDGEQPTVVRVDDNTDRLVRIVVRTGARLPRVESAQGKVFLAFGPDAAELEDARRATRPHDQRTQHHREQQCDRQRKKTHAERQERKFDAGGILEDEHENRRKRDDGDPQGGPNGAQSRVTFAPICNAAESVGAVTDSLMSIVSLSDANPAGADSTVRRPRRARGGPGRESRPQRT